jgi:hypothetical protein
MNQVQTITQQMQVELALDSLDDFVRVPGLLRRWEIEQVVTSGAEYRIEEAGELADKTQVFAVYRRDHSQTSAGADVGVPVGLTFDDDKPPVRARLLPISGDEPLMAVLVLGDSAEDAATLARVRDHLARAGSNVTSAPGSRGHATRVQEGAAR